MKENINIRIESAFKTNLENMAFSLGVPLSDFVRAALMYWAQSFMIHASMGGDVKAVALKYIRDADVYEKTLELQGEYWELMNHPENYQPDEIMTKLNFIGRSFNELFSTGTNILKPTQKDETHDSNE